MKYFMMLILAAAACFAADADQKLILTSAVDERFDIADYRVPLETHGDAHVCLWEDDKTGAFTYTVDGNWDGDHKFWMAAMDSFGIPVTFFIITHKVGTDLWSPWDSVIALHYKGHDIQSHSATHGNGLWQYEASKDSIQSAMPFHTCMNIAYPGGSGTTAYPDTAIMVGYNGCRGGVGKINRVVKTNYENSWSTSVWNEENTLNWVESADYGWKSFHMHKVGSSGGPDTINTRLAFLKTVEDRLWLGKYSSVSRYGQERDTHTLTVTSVTEDLVSFTLSDSMNDSIFTYPLTVRVRVAGWDTVRATQDGEPVEAELKTDSLGVYALVKAVPDQGTVTLSSGGTAFISDAPATVLRGMATDVRLYNVSGNPVTGRQGGFFLQYDPATGALRKVMVLQ